MREPGLGWAPDAGMESKARVSWEKSKAFPLPQVESPFESKGGTP